MHDEELKALIASKLDVAEFLDILGYTIYDLVDILDTEIRMNREELQKACE